MGSYRQGMRMGWSCDDVAAVVEAQARNIHGDGYEFLLGAFHLTFDTTFLLSTLTFER